VSAIAIVKFTIKMSRLIACETSRRGLRNTLASVGMIQSLGLEERRGVRRDEIPGHFVLNPAVLKELKGTDHLFPTKMGDFQCFMTGSFAFSRVVQYPSDDYGPPFHRTRVGCGSGPLPTPTPTLTLTQMAPALGDTNDGLNSSDPSHIHTSIADFPGHTTRSGASINLSRPPFGKIGPALSFHTIPYHTIPYHTIPYHTIPYHTIPYHTIPYHTIPRTSSHPYRQSVRSRFCVSALSPIPKQSRRHRR
jgi:hypothetical protein